MGEMDGKRALITGAAQGLGLATARLLVERGAQVLIADIDEAGAKGAADELGESARAIRFKSPVIFRCLMSRSAAACTRASSPT